jgi:hypothetical protein
MGNWPISSACGGHPILGLPERVFVPYHISEWGSESTGIARRRIYAHQYHVNSLLIKGAPRGLSASANCVTGKTLLDKPAVAPDFRMFFGFSTGC